MQAGNKHLRIKIMNVNRLIFCFLTGLMFLSQACYDDYKIDFDDSATYFARQHPLRTLVVEDDKDLTFEVGVVIAGNRPSNISSDTRVSFKIDEELLEEYKEDFPNLRMLPSAYYTISADMNSSGEYDDFDIVKGDGTLRVTKVTLDKEAFLRDSLAHEAVYALPLRITGTTTFKIAEAEDGTKKDYTIVVVKYANQYEGSYWLRGADYTTNSEGEYVDTTLYRNKDLVLGRDLLLTTMSKDELLTDYIGENDARTGNFSMKIKVREDGVCELDAVETSDLSGLLGAGRYNKEERIFTLDYSYLSAVGATHEVFDTIYYRNTEIYIEDWFNGTAY